MMNRREPGLVALPSASAAFARLWKSHHAVFCQGPEQEMAAVR